MKHQHQAKEAAKRSPHASADVQSKETPNNHTEIRHSEAHHEVATSNGSAANDVQVHHAPTEALSSDAPLPHTTEPASANAMAALQEQLKKALAERDEYKELSLRKVAELENFRRRSEQERSELLSFGNHKLLLKMLPILDDLGRAVESGKQGSDYKALLEGIELVYTKAVQTFEEAGVKAIESVGKQFDVNFHEALMQMPSEAPAEQILQEAQRGYLYGDKVLRHAKVIISSGMPQDSETQA